jgi:hypothetical protein
MSIINPLTANNVLGPIDRDAANPNISWGASFETGQNSGTGIRGSFTTMTHSVAGVDKMVVSASGVAMGGGTAITKVLKGTVSVTVAALLTGTQADVEVTIAGVGPTDTIVVTPLAAAMEASLGIVGAFYSTANKIKIRTANLGAGTLTGSTTLFNYTITQS